MDRLIEVKTCSVLMTIERYITVYRALVRIFKYEIVSRLVVYFVKTLWKNVVQL